jgi:hypothetical protein
MTSDADNVDLSLPVVGWHGKLVVEAGVEGMDSLK